MSACSSLTGQSRISWPVLTPLRALGQQQVRKSGPILGFQLGSLVLPAASVGCHPAVTYSDPAPGDWMALSAGMAGEGTGTVPGWAGRSGELREDWGHCPCPEETLRPWMEEGWGWLGDIIVCCDLGALRIRGTECRITASQTG